MEYKNVIAELENRVYKAGINYSLENFISTLTFFDNPQVSESKIIHVAGTNGKGSTIAFLEAALIEGGYSVATFTSPHIESYRERFRLNGNEIAPDNFIALFKHIKSVEAQYPDLQISTEFEALTLMAFLFFKQKAPDFILLEVGLGGRLDATNVVSPALSIITPIGLDHEAILGNTIRKIAAEKAGIIKPNTPVISAMQHRDARSVIEQKAGKENAPLTFCEPVECIPETYSLTGAYQRQNLALARAAIQILLGDSVLKKVENGFKAAENWGRFTCISLAKTTIIIDAGHNADGINATLNAIRIDFPYQPIAIVMGFAKHKNGSEMLKHLEAVSNDLYYMEFDTTFATSFSQIQNWASKTICEIKTIDKDMLSKHPLILITGSIYFLGAIKTVLHSLAVSQ